MTQRDLLSGVLPASETTNTGGNMNTSKVLYLESGIGAGGIKWSAAALECGHKDFAEDDKPRRAKIGDSLFCRGCESAMYASSARRGKVEKMALALSRFHVDPESVRLMDDQEWAQVASWACCRAPGSDATKAEVYIRLREILSAT